MHKWAWSMVRPHSKNETLNHQTTLRYSSVKHVRKGGTHWGKSDLENRPGLLFGQSAFFIIVYFSWFDAGFGGNAIAAMYNVHTCRKDFPVDHKREKMVCEKIKYLKVEIKWQKCGDKFFVFYQETLLKNLKFILCSRLCKEEISWFPQSHEKTWFDDYSW